MVKENRAKEYRKRNNTDLVEDLKKLLGNLQIILFTNGLGTAVAKLFKIKSLKK